MLDWIKAMPHQLSGGQQQRIALARALAPKPGIVLLDEPFSNLDPALRAQVRADIRRIFRVAGATAVLVTHDQEEALSMADRVAILLDGELQQFDSPQRIYQQPLTKDVARFVGDAHFLDGVIVENGIETALGVLPLEPHTSEPGERETVLLRPELVTLHPEAHHDGGTARISHVVFFGRDQVVEATLDSGETIVARCPTHHLYTPGDRVHITVDHPLHLMPRDNKNGEA
jgi:iron(III) transport system ATP-binding protein